MSKFAKGARALAICDRCGVTCPYNSLKQLTINKKATGLRVCDDCYEPDHPQYRVGDLKVHDGQALRNARPDGNSEAYRSLTWGWNPVVGVPLASSVGVVTVTVV